MNTDYSYCSGTNCPISNKCKRYLPDKPIADLWYIEPSYNHDEEYCSYFKQKSENIHSPLGFDYTESEERMYHRACQEAAEFMQSYGKGSTASGIIRNPNAYIQQAVVEKPTILVCRSARCPHRKDCQLHANMLIVNRNRDDYHEIINSSCYSTQKGFCPNYTPKINDNEN